MRPIQTLIVDDSALMRRMLALALGMDDRIQVVGAVDSADAARKAIRQLNPDVLTLDLEMPGMDGATFLGKLMAARPMPAIIVSSLAQHTSVLGMRLLELGAFDFMAKPNGAQGEGLHAFGADLCARVVAAAKAAPAIRARAQKANAAQQGSSTLPVAESRLQLIAIGASTGGVPAVQALLARFGPATPPIAIAQHMPEGFTDRFAKTLTRHTSLNVCEATDGLRLSAGMAAIAPGQANLTVDFASGAPVCRLTAPETDIGPTPSIDVLFRSAARAFRSRVAAGLLTGMGRDGAEGLAAIRKAGGFTAAQDEASCVVFGMPRAAIEMGAAAFVGPPVDIARELVDPKNAKA